MSSAKAELIERLRALKNRYPLSSGQLGLWLDNQINPADPRYNLVVAIELGHGLDAAVLERLLQDVLRRHRVLSARFSQEDGRVVQILDAEPAWPVTRRPVAAGDAALNDLIRELGDEPFDLAHEPALRVDCLTQGARHVLLLRVHHILVDLLSLQRVLQDLITLFASGELPAETTELSYRDHVVAEAKWLDSASGLAQLDHWREVLAGLTQPTRLPGDLGSGHGVGDAVPLRAKRSLNLDAALSSRLRQLAREEGVTPYVLMLTLYASVLRRYVGTPEVCIGCPVSDRARPEWYEVTGYFANLVTLRLPLSDGDSLRTRLRTLKPVCLEAITNGRYPFNKMVEVLDAGHAVGTSGFSHLSFIWDKYDPEMVLREGAALPGGFGRVIHAEQRGVLGDVSLVVIDDASTFSMTLGYDARQFSAHYIEGMMDALRRLAELAVTADRDAPLPDPFGWQVIDAEQAWQGAPCLTIDRLLGLACEVHAHRPAVLHEGEVWTFGELQDRAWLLAGWLRSQGVGPECSVGVCLQRTPVLAQAIVAVMMAGGAYVPLDPSHPPDRLAHIASDSGMALVLVDGTTRGLFADSQARLVDISALQLPPDAGRPFEAGHMPDHLAYVIYTSGSTGLPKGTQISHVGFNRLLAWSRHAYGDEDMARVLFSTSVGFDLSVFELLVTLCRGGSVVMVDNLMAWQPSLPAQQVTLVNTVPSVLQAFLNEQAWPSSVRVLNLAGEPISDSLLETIGSWPDAPRLFNLYGPTEDTTYSTACEVQAPVAPGAAHLGRPLTGTRLYLLDEGMRPVPPGTVGEIYLGGMGLARSYLRRPGMTADRFLPDPGATHAGARMYRTGDLARVDAQGQLQYLGRVDHQIKLRGLRIELGEIEHALAQCAGVEQAVVLAAPIAAGEPVLVACLKGHAPSIDKDSLPRLLKAALPAYMVPARFQLLSEFPLSPNGKIDRKALLASLAHEAPTPGEVEAPVGHLEAHIAGVWCEVLGLPEVGRHAHFFELGGHSLLALRVKSRLNRELGVTLSVQQLWSNLTVAALAELIGQQRGSEATDWPLARWPHATQGAPLSFAQERLWYLARSGEGLAAAYHVPMACTWQGPLEQGLFEQALMQLMRDHEALRTRFIDTPDGPRQVVVPLSALSVPLSVHHLTEDEVPRGQRHDDLMHAHVGQAFALDTAPLWRVLLITSPTQGHVVQIVMHHLVVDGWSLGVLLGDLSARYRALCSGEVVAPAAPAWSYLDHCHSERQWVAQGLLDQQVRNWTDALADPPPPLVLTRHDEALAPLAGTAGVHYATLDAAVAAPLGRLAQRHDATPFMVLLAVFGELMRRWSGQRDMLIGVPVAHRGRPEFESVAGLFVNTVLVRLQLPESGHMGDLIAHAKARALFAFANQDVPFDHVARTIKGRRAPSEPVFNVMFALQSFPQSLPTWPGVTLARLRTEQPAAKMDLSLECSPQPDGGYELRFEYDRGVWADEAVQQLAGHYLTLLRATLAAPELPRRSLGMLSAQELSEQAGWHGAYLPIPPAGSVLGLIARHAVTTPHAPALVEAGLTLSHAELHQRSNQLARWLVAQGCVPEQLVGVAMPRSAWMVVALLAVLKAGATYVPLDPASPHERLADAVKDAGLAGILTLNACMPSLKDAGCAVWAVDADWHAAAGSQPDSAPGIRPTSLNLAYAIYTSGSTGRPKAVQITHGGLLNLVAWQLERFGPDIAAGSTLLANPVFDATVLELWPALVSGGPVHIMPPTLSHDMDGYLDWLLNVPAAFSYVPTPLVGPLGDRFGERPAQAARPYLRTVWTGGDALRLPARWPVDVRLVNNYGPTEITVAATSGLVDLAAGKTPHIGRAIGNTRVYLLDEAMQPVPKGVAGQIWIGGEGVARGYLRRPAMTAERFVPDPWSPQAGARMYGTGDLGRWLADGDIEFLGRQDHQVKIRGHRIELGEVESALRGCKQVREAVVLALPQGPQAAPALVAYVVAQQPDGVPSVAQLRQALRDRLPGYMVPSAFVALDKLPLTPNGKLDRAALPAPQDSAMAAGDSYEEPSTPTQARLAAIWAQVLGVEKVGVNDDFFALGGHSLTALQLATRVREAWGRTLNMRWFMAHPTVAEMALWVQAASPDGAGAQAGADMPRLDKADAYPTSFAQQRLWFMDQYETASGLYNVPLVAELRGRLDVAALEAALHDIVTRHAILRTTFEQAPAGGVVQQVDETVRLPFTRTDAAIDMSAIQAEVERPFDLRRGPLIRALLAGPEQDRSVLVLTMHHIVADGWSVPILLAELGQAYAARCADQAPAWPELPVQYADFAAWQRAQSAQWDAAQRYWTARLGGTDLALNLPLDRPRPPTETHRGQTHSFPIPADTGEALKRWCAHARVTPFSALIAVFAGLLARYASQNQVSIGYPVSGRGHRAIEDLIGCFVNTQVLLADIGEQDSLAGLVDQVRQHVGDAHEHQDFPFERLVDLVQRERSLERSPLFQVLFTYTPHPGDLRSMQGLDVQALEVPSSYAKFDLSLAVWDSGSGLRARIEYKQDLFDQRTIERFGAHYLALLSGALAQPDLAIRKVPLLTHGERDEMGAAWRSAILPFDGGQTLHGLFELQADATPDAPALVCGGARLSYRELDRRANRLAHRLIAMGCGPEQLVGVALVRSADLIVALLAVLKSGAAYVPLDPVYPADRVAYMVDDAQAICLLTQSSLAARFERGRTRLVCIDDDEVPSAEAFKPDADRPHVAVSSQHTAYCIYTSGSTGRPKAVCLQHSNAVAFLAWVRQHFDQADMRHVVASTSICFDLSIFEIFGTLSMGGMVELVDDLLALNPQAKASQAGPSLINTVPSAIKAALQAGLIPADLRRINLAGEPLSPQLVAALKQAQPGWQIRNLYGPSETTTYSTCADVTVTESGKVTVGRAIGNTRVYLLDEAMQPVPKGVAGQIWIGGEGVARGYLRRPAMTAERFVPDPWSPQAGARMYGTGDLGRWLADGDIEFLGRQDHQVKIRGHRIELGEVESALRGCKQVREAVVLALPQGPQAAPALVAYVVAQQPDGVPSVAQLRQALRDRLPGYMVPSAFVALDKLPLTPNGKLDRAALPAPQDSAMAAGDSYEEPSTPTQARLAAIWAQVLGVEKVGVNDDFFALGGHSLMAAELSAQVREAFGCVPPLKSLFLKPTVRHLADALDELLRQGASQEAPATIVRQDRRARAAPNRMP